MGLLVSDPDIFILRTPGVPLYLARHFHPPVILNRRRCDVYFLVLILFLQLGSNRKVGLEVSKLAIIASLIASC